MSEQVGNEYENMRFDIDEDESALDVIYMTLLLSSILHFRSVDKQIFLNENLLDFFPVPLFGRLNNYINSSFKLSATFVCPLLRPLKAPEYIEAARNFRLLFKGISATTDNARMLHRQFVEAVNFEHVRAMRTVNDIFASEFSNFFQIPVAP